MRLKLFGSAAVLAFCGAIALPGVATAGNGAETIVTIKEAASGDFFGYVKSPQPVRCAKERKVTLYKQLGATQMPSSDDKINSDNASKQGDKYRWDTGNTNTSGKVYARARKIEHCQGDSSPTIESSAR